MNILIEIYDSIKIVRNYNSSILRSRGYHAGRFFEKFLLKQIRNKRERNELEIETVSLTKLNFYSSSILYL